ncbi:hypothetical protein HKT18_11795 [Flavobacterium sp. IMCC34852]|uniref:Uncharacterized protein n=1 Tax=Flavobacterium rivulicola TaxID=2732161 RepID=A0A7Y3VZV6_9FLAO|nr:hypothetical protein [Flavobacterium sp. IMCC34852]NNT72901.1 hypothetical protein [Flavobacterium sp. IMCC34852]
MKKTLTLALLFLSMLSYSQQITMEKGRFYLGGNRIDSREARNLFATNVKAAALYKQAKSKEALGGFLLGFGIGLTVGDLAIGLFSDKKYPTEMTYVGVGSIVISIPVLSGRKKRYEEAVSIYNSEHKELKLGATNTTVNLNAIANQNGIGFQLKF